MTHSCTINDMIRAATDAGASGAFVACLATTQPHSDELRNHRHLPRAKVRGLLSRDWFEDSPADGQPPFGGFMTELWNGNTERAWRRADTRNIQLMITAGVTPE